MFVFIFFCTNKLIIFNFFFVDPYSVELNIDGTTDKCSKGEDINFIFTGFTLSGKVSFKMYIPAFTMEAQWPYGFCAGLQIKHYKFKPWLALGLNADFI